MLSIIHAEYDPLVIEAIWIDQQSTVDWLVMLKIAHSRVAIAKHIWNQKSGSRTVSQRSFENSGSVKGSILLYEWTSLLWFYM